VNKIKFVMLALLSTVMASNVAVAADRVGDFSLLDQDGYFHNMSWYDDQLVIAFLVQANDSDATAAALPDFTALQQKYSARGIEFMMINPMGRLNRAAVKAKLVDYGVDIPVLMDDTRIVSEALGIDRSGEVLLFNPDNFKVEYKGSVAAAEQAIQELLAGSAVSTPRVATNGAAVTYPLALAQVSNPPSYSKDIAPIIAENCASCHRAGGIAPFAMDSHAMVQGWSPMIREVLMTKRMPPGQIDGHVGKFLNDMLLSASEVQKIVHWIEAGAPQDGDRDPLTQLSWPDTKWAFGEPDYIIKVPPQSIPASGVLDYIHLSVPIDIKEDRWVRASQYVPGDRTVLHHTINIIVEPGASRRGGFLGGSNPDQANITAYIPGAEPAMEPPNTGGLLKAGSTLNLQLHYTTNGKETVDASEIGLWFYPEGEIPEERMSGQCACIFAPSWTNIPPNDPNFEQTRSITLRRDAQLYSFLPHMHFRGKYMRFHADYPDGTREELINIANYNYNWQLNYTYQEPKFMPAGTVLTAVGAFDNSARNPANPDPQRSVPWGQQSWDEMFFGAIQWKYIK
jgi:mono/diheme cytochrome c family protein